MLRSVRSDGNDLLRALSLRGRNSPKMTPASVPHDSQLSSRAPLLQAGQTVLHASTQNVLQAPSPAHKSAQRSTTHFAPQPRTIAELKAHGFHVADLETIDPTRFPDLVVVAPAEPGDPSLWIPFHVGRDCVARASNTVDACLHSGMSESESNEIILWDTSAATVRHAFHWLYERKGVPTLQNAIALAGLLDYWNPEGRPTTAWQELLTLCNTVINEHVTPLNAVELWKAADKHGAREIGNALAERILNSDVAIASFASHPDLNEGALGRLLGNPHINCAEDRVVQALESWSSAQNIDNHETFWAATPLIAAVRWQLVSETCLWHAVDAEMLNLTDAGEIAHLRFKLSSGIPASELTLFGETLGDRKSKSATVPSSILVSVADAQERPAFTVDIKVPNYLPTSNMQKGPIMNDLTVPFESRGNKWNLSFEHNRFDLCLLNRASFGGNGTVKALGLETYEASTGMTLWNPRECWHHFNPSPPGRYQREKIFDPVLHTDEAGNLNLRIVFEFSPTP